MYIRAASRLIHREVTIRDDYIICADHSRRNLGAIGSFLPLVDAAADSRRNQSERSPAAAPFSDQSLLWPVSANQPSARSLRSLCY
jgi:hypothetical protein